MISASQSLHFHSSVLTSHSKVSTSSLATSKDTYRNNHQLKSVYEDTKQKNHNKPKLQKPKEVIAKPPVDVPAKPLHTLHKVAPLSHRKPRLAIIIDDVHTRKQIEMIQAIGFPVTPSIFPPYALSPHTDRLTHLVRHYMIHLPMESGSAKFNRQTGTLLRRFSADRIDRAIRKLRFEFPEARWINNHTGSRFTADKAAMERLYEALKRYDFYFLDSKTTPKSQVRGVVEAYGDCYIKRDIFIDNVQQPNAIRMQLRKAVAIAKKRGYAVAIGHPYPVTLRTLRASQDILKGVAVVYIDELVRSLR